MAQLRSLSILCGLLLFGLPQGARASELPPSHFEMTPGLVVVLDVTRPIDTVVVGDPNVADVTVVAAERITVTAFREGRTSIILFDDEKDVIHAAEATVVPLARGLGRRTVRVHSFAAGGAAPIVRSYYCARRGAASPGCRADPADGVIAAPVAPAAPVTPPGATNASDAIE